MRSLPSGQNLRAATIWFNFHFIRNVGRRAFLIWVVVIAAGVLLLSGPIALPGEKLAHLVVAVLTPLLSLFFGASALREEIEDQTLTYGFSRPVGRTWLYGARVLAQGGPVVALMVPVALFVGARLGPAIAGRYALSVVLAAAAYTTVFALVGQLVRRPAWVGLFFILFWENTIGQVPGFLGKLTLIAHVRTVAGLSPLTQPTLARLYAPSSPAMAALTLLVVMLLALLVGGTLVKRREHALPK